ncbi:class I SAM-dependent methyltransferase [Streptacidiphilus monticola]|jgi:SAM-dependent methyltransferase|uniref:Class I SAM-dependent methyltransferase n=1 Tax=Streptacidiphilus monticola TaxID=2161674 RepID=A0ABW1G7K4_9ACTN
MTIFDEAERRVWAGRAEAYGRSYAKLCAYPVPQLLDGVQVAAGTALLDVGTGTGAVAEAAVARGARVRAVDADAGMVAAAAERVPEARVSQAVLPELPFGNGEFDVVAANFVLNHVGRPAAALRELRRVLRPGGRAGLTIWAVPAAGGQSLVPRALNAAGAVRPGWLPSLDPEHDFERSESGLAALVRAAGFTAVEARTLRWEHRATPDEWWAGPANGVAAVGRTLLAQGAAVQQEARRQFELLAAEFAAPDGTLVLPHAALLVIGVA